MRHEQLRHGAGAPTVSSLTHRWLIHRSPEPDPVPKMSKYQFAVADVERDVGLLHVHGQGTWLKWSRARWPNA